MTHQHMCGLRTAKTGRGKGGARGISGGVSRVMNGSHTRPQTLDATEAKGLGHPAAAFLPKLLPNFRGVAGLPASPPLANPSAWRL